MKENRVEKQRKEDSSNRKLITLPQLSKTPHLTLYHPLREPTFREINLRNLPEFPIPLKSLDHFRLHKSRRGPKTALPPKLHSLLRALIVLCSICKANGYDKSDYLFKDIAGTIYRLWFSGLENLVSIVPRLMEGYCNTNTTTQVPDEFVVVEEYYDHGVTVPIYSAILSRDAKGTTNKVVEDCVSGLLKIAHDEWVNTVSSGKAIAIMVGVILFIVVAIAGVTGVAVYCSSRKKSSEPNEETKILPQASI